MSWIRLNEGCTIRTTENARASCTLVGDIGIALGGVFWFTVWYIPICTCMYATLLQLQGITAFEVTRLSSYIQLSLYNPTIILASNVGQNFGVVTKFTFIACFSTEGSAACGTLVFTPGASHPFFSLPLDLLAGLSDVNCLPKTYLSSPARLSLSSDERGKCRKVSGMKIYVFDRVETGERMSCANGLM
jgi:hypothetical protein